LGERLAELLSAGAVVGALRLAGLFRFRGLQAMPEGVTLSHFPYLVRQLGWQLALSPAEVGLFFALPIWLLRRWLPLWITALVTLLLFGASHDARPHVTPLVLLSIAVVVGLPTLTLSLVRGFWAAAGWHFGWNLLLGPVFGATVAGDDVFGWLDSTTTGAALWTGGLYGPEGSLTACLINGGLFGLLLWRVLRRRRSDSAERT